MRALVTGCAGFIGSHLVDRLLEEGYKVIGIDCFTDYYPKEIKVKNISNALKNENFKLIKEDILNIDNFPDVDYVFHLAAQAGVRASWGKNFNTYVRNNIETTQKLLEYYKDKKIKKFVYASSSSVYGNVEIPMKEDSALKPISPYGVTKLAGENLCHLYWINYGVPVVSLRYFTVYGERQRPDMAIHKFVKAILNDESVIVYGDGTQTRDYVYVKDVVEATILAAESDFTGEVFNIGGGMRISVNELIKVLEDITEKSAKVVYVEKQKGDVKDTLADISKAKSKLGWKPKVKIKEGIERFVEWYRREIKKE